MNVFKGIHPRCLLVPQSVLRHSCPAAYFPAGGSCGLVPVPTPKGQGSPPPSPTGGPLAARGAGLPGRPPRSDPLPLDGGVLRWPGGWVADFARFPQVPARHYVLEWPDGKMTVVQRD